MQIESRLLGTIQVKETDIFAFPEGLYGMEEHKRYAVVRPDQQLPFAYLQATDEPGVCLLIADPFAFRHNYEFDLPSQDVEKLQAPAQGYVAVWVTVSARDSLQDATMNLMAPVVLNTEQRIGRQVVLHNSDYETRTPLFAQKEAE